MKEKQNKGFSPEAELKKMLFEALIRAGKDAAIDEEGCIVIRRARQGTGREDRRDGEL